MGEGQGLGRRGRVGEGLWGGLRRSVLTKGAECVYFASFQK